jgi:uroporphyrinogen-III decarboxylase
MNQKERWLNTLEGKVVDRLLFWPKLDDAYLHAHGEEMGYSSLAQIHDWIGSDKHLFLANIYTNTSTKATEKIEQHGVQKITTYTTPHGSTQSEHHFDIVSQSWHPVAMPVKNREDIEIMLEWYSNYTPELDQDKLADVIAEYNTIGDSAITAVELDESPLMYFVEWLAGVENAHLMLYDYKDLLVELFEQMHKTILREMAITCEHSPVDVIYMIENTSTTLISPKQFKKYCLPYLQEYTHVALSAQRKIAYHMCGHLNKLLPTLNQLNGVGFEAFTSPPIGNTRLIDGRKNLPNKCLLGGTNATLWTQSFDEIVRELQSDLEDLPHHRGIVITSGGVMPPQIEVEKIKAVCEWVKQYSVNT